jgi:hypothetical protein
MLQLIVENMKTAYRIVHKSSKSFEGDVILQDNYGTSTEALADVSHYEDRFSIEVEIECYEIEETEELKAKSEEQKKEIRQWLIGMDFEGLAESL